MAVALLLAAGTRTTRWLTLTHLPRSPRSKLLLTLYLDAEETMARRMIGSSGASNSSSSRRSISPPVAKSRTALPRARRCLFVSVHNCCLPQPVRGAAWRRAMQDSEREGVAGGRRCRQILNVRHAVVLSSDGTRDKIGSQSGCFPTACLAQPRAAKFCWFAAVWTRHTNQDLHGWRALQQSRSARRWGHL